MCIRKTISKNAASHVEVHAWHFNVILDCRQILIKTVGGNGLFQCYFACYEEYLSSFTWIYNHGAIEQYWTHIEHAIIILLNYYLLVLHATRSSTFPFYIKRYIILKSCRPDYAPFIKLFLFLSFFFKLLQGELTMNAELWTLRYCSKHFICVES